MTSVARNTPSPTGRSNCTTDKTYRGGQIEALYREIFALQTDAGWQDKRDFTAWYASHGWSDRRPRDLKIPGTISSPLILPQAIMDEKVRNYREAMQTGRWADSSSDPVIVLADGEVSDGHHRLCAASEVDWAIVLNPPVFTVVFRSDVMPD
jgi:hypothetical protein